MSSKSKRSIRKSSKVKLNQIKAKLGGNESVDQKIKIKNIILFLTYEKKVLIFFRDYSLLLSEDRANYWERLKILTPKQTNVSKISNSFCTSKSR